MTALAPHIEAFLREHLVRQRGASPHTCDSYAYSFRALFTFAAQRLKTAPCALTLEQLDASLVGAFLEQLETMRRNGGGDAQRAPGGHPRLLPVSAAPRAGRP
jgi:site-specific recombinase XerC